MKNTTGGFCTPEEPQVGSPEKGLEKGVPKRRFRQNLASKKSGAVGRRNLILRRGELSIHLQSLPGHDYACMNLKEMGGRNIMLQWERKYR